MRFTAIAAVLVMAAFTACSSGDSASLRQWQGELPIAEAFLRRQLPAGVMAYARVPSLLGLFAMPKQGQLDAALRTEANIRNIQSIQQGLARNVLSLPGLSDPRIRFLADAVRSPVEVAGMALPMPAVLIGATLAPRSADEFNALLSGLGQVQPSVSLAAPLDDQGIGELAGVPLPAFVHFDAANGRLLLFAGAAVNRAGFEQLLQNLPAQLEEHPMYALEQQIDASGQGLFAWVDAAQVMPLVASSVAQPLGKAALGGLRAAAFGVGTANGKGRLSLVLDAGVNRQARPIPVVANDIKATSVGDPDAAVVFSIPDPAEIARLEAMYLDALPPGARVEWEKTKAGAEALFGVGVEEIFSAIGPDVLVLFDQAGDYTALRVRDATLFDDIVARIAAKTGSAPEEHRIGGTTFQHLKLPSFFSLAAAFGTPTEPGLGADLLAVLGRAQEHVYWMRDGEYLYMAQTPQPLIDRVNAGAKARVADWLADTQRVDMSTSLFAATGSVSKMPRRSYEMYISILQFLADIADAQFDVWSMPTADQLELPPKGAVGISINLGEPYLSMELTYGNHPGELLFGSGGVGAVAMTGILAGIAVPAYQDYTIRAQVTEGLNLAAGVKVAVSESYASRGALPRDRRAAGLPPAPDATSGQYVDAVDVSRGVIRITYGNQANASLRGRTLAMAPVAVPGGDLVWICGHARLPSGARAPVSDAFDPGELTTVAAKYLPSACR